MKLRFPYFYQLMVGILFIIVTLMIIMFASIRHFGRNQILNNMEESLFYYAELIVEAQSDPTTLRNYNEILRNQQIEYGIFNREGSLEYPTPNQEIQVNLEEDQRENLESGNAILLQTQTSNLRGNQEEIALVYVPILTSGGTYEGFIGIGRPRSHIEVQMDDLTNNVLRAFLLSAIVAVVMSLLISYFLVKRVNRLSKASQKVAQGDYDVYIDHTNRDEIDRLSADFNKMIKALKEWRKEVLHLEDRRKTFMQDVAHEMRTPLTTINGLLEGLEHGIFDEKQELRSIQLMRKETTRLIRLVNENLDYENIQSNRIVLRKNHFPLIEAIEEVREQLSTIADESNNKMLVDENIKEITVYADFDRLKQIIVNLLKNALQFTVNGTITISAMQTSEVTEISISDTGPGMTDEQIENIWDRYYKADPSRKNTKYGESGLGLPIVKQLVELHEGHIKVESELGQGSTFTMIFPRWKVSEEE